MHPLPVATPLNEQGFQAPVAVVMIALNEAHNMAAVLENLRGWAQEVFLVDSYSSDETVDIALKYGVHVVQREFRGFGDQWNFALNELPITAPWTMKLDPDERISDDLKAEIADRLGRENADGYQCPIRLFFMDRALPVRLKMTRLWRTGAANFTHVEANEHAIVAGNVLEMRSDIEHRDSPDLNHWWEKQNMYTTAEAVAAFGNRKLSEVPKLFGTPLQRRVWFKKHYMRFPFRYVALFLYHYIVLGTWRAGWVGYVWSRLRCDVYRFWEYKLREIMITGRMPMRRPQPYGAPHPGVAQYRAVRSSAGSTPPEKEPESAPVGATPKPTILVFTRYYLPGFLAGGPIRTIANMVERLSTSFDFRIVTQDRDYGAAAPYSEVDGSKWIRKGSALVRYVPPNGLGLAEVARIIRSTPHDAVYLNSFFDYRFTQQVLINRKLGTLPERPVVLAPRGEFSEGALRFKYLKKRPFIRLAKGIGLYDRLVWQASSSLEAEDIEKTMAVSRDSGTAGGCAGRIAVAADLTDPGGTAGVLWEDPSRTEGGALRACFLSRISPMKNLDYALRVLATVSLPVCFTVYGPIEDEVYWSTCQGIIAKLPPNIKVVYAGAIAPDRIFQELRQHDLFFFPTRGENFGHVIHEALRSGLPVLISDQTPWRDLELQGVGWSIPLSQPLLFAERLVEVAGWSREERRLVAAKAMHVAEAVGQDPATLEANRRLFLDAISEHGRSRPSMCQGG